MKIAITDESHLKEVCELLEQLGYSDTGHENKNPVYVLTYDDGLYHKMGGVFVGSFYELTITDLIKMRDEMK